MVNCFHDEHIHTVFSILDIFASHMVYNIWTAFLSRCCQIDNLDCVNLRPRWGSRTLLGSEALWQSFSEIDSQSHDYILSDSLFDLRSCRAYCVRATWIKLQYIQVTLDGSSDLGYLSRYHLPDPASLRRPSASKGQKPSSLTQNGPSFHASNPFRRPSSVLLVTLPLYARRGVRDRAISAWTNPLNHFHPPTLPQFGSLWRDSDLSEAPATQFHRGSLRWQSALTADALHI